MTFQPATAPEKINCLSTRGLFLYYSDMEAIGGFHPFLLPHYWSDYEFTLRAARKGFRLVTSDEAVLNLQFVEPVFRRIEQMRFMPLKAFLKFYFSKKAVLNPVFKSSFIFLACPLPFTAINLLTTWMNAGGDVMRHLAWRTRIYFKTVDLKRKIKKAHGEIKIIIGSAGLQTDDWISTDFPALDLTDEQTFARLFKPGSVDVFLAEHVWEHLSVTEAVLGIKNCMKYLKPGGYLRLAVPDGNHPDPDYIEKVKPGGRGPGADGHKVLYDHNMLSGMLRQEGFIVTRLEWYDQKGHFNFEDWSPADGMVRRSMRFDPRNQSASLKYTSLIIDGYKPA
jgi:predicted SAM-dependent methyltransferase